MVAHVSVHDKGDGNPHAHIMLTMRPLDGDGFSRKKNRDWNKTERLLEWHKEYERLTNQYLERYGHEERIDIRSYAEQGINQVPTIHLGSYAHRMKQQGVYTERWEINQRIEEQNKEISEINRQIDECRKEAEQIRDEVAQKEKQGQEEFEKQSAEDQEHFRTEPASTGYDILLEHYRRAEQAVREAEEALQDRLTEKGKQDLAGQEQKIENARKMLWQQTPEPDTSDQDTQTEG